MSQTPRHGLAYLSPGQVDADVIHNEALNTIDAVASLNVLDRTQSEAPTATDGDCYIVAATPPGGDDWEGYPIGAVALYIGGAWRSLWRDADGNPTVPATGARAWIQNEKALAVFNGDSWEILAIESIVVKEADETRTTDTTLAPDAELAAALLANTKYHFEAEIQFDTQATPDFKIGVFIPAGATMSVTLLSFNPGGSSPRGAAITASGASGEQAVAGNFAGRGWVRLSGWVEVDATAGDLEIGWAQNTSEAGATTVLRQSWLKTRISGLNP